MSSEPLVCVTGVLASPDFDVLLLFDLFDTGGIKKLNLLWVAKAGRLKRSKAVQNFFVCLFVGLFVDLFCLSVLACSSTTVRIAFLLVENKKKKHSPGLMLSKQQHQQPNPQNRKTFLILRQTHIRLAPYQSRVSQ